MEAQAQIVNIKPAHLKIEVAPPVLKSWQIKESAH